jgi:hypothetical protein
MLPERVFRYSSGKPWHFIVLGVAIACWIAFGLLRWSETGRFGGGWLLGLAVLAVLAPMATRGLYDLRPVLVVSAQGVWFRGWNRTELLPWSRVTSIEKIAFGRGEAFIALRVQGEQRRPGDALPQHALRTSMLDLPTTEAMELLEQYWREAR